MPQSQNTLDGLDSDFMTNKIKSEAGFEAEIRGHIERIFHWLPSDQITHQDSFSFKFGHKNVTVDGKPVNHKRAYADILLQYQDQPLAILELKRADKNLIDADGEQGLSYARMLHPSPPLVVVSNGKETRFLDRSTGNLWKPENKSESSLKALITSAAKVAQSNRKQAISTLMGTNSKVWVQAVRQVTTETLSQFTGKLQDPLYPFAENFLIPRAVTRDVIQALRSEKLISVVGDPLSGKSNVLRELAELSVNGDDFAVLYLNVDHDVSLYQQLADILTETLTWPVSPDEAHQWLIHLSKAKDTSLVLALDHIGPDSSQVRQDIERLTSTRTGKGLHVVVALDCTVAEQLSFGGNNRYRSTFDSRAKRFDVEPLDDREFAHMVEYLKGHRMYFIKGSERSLELRTPWLIRAIAADTVVSPNYEDITTAALLPPMLGLEALHLARLRFEGNDPSNGYYFELAKALLSDLQESVSSDTSIFERLYSFIVRRDTARKHLDYEELRELIDIGLVRLTRSASKENSYTIRLPELMAIEVSNVIGEQLRKPNVKLEEQVKALVKMATELPLGDVIVAEALFQAAISCNGLVAALIEHLISIPPRKVSMSPRTKFAMELPSGEIIQLTVLNDDRMEVVNSAGLPCTFEMPEAERPQTIVDHAPYLILSHLVGHMMGVFDEDGKIVQRMDYQLLAQIGDTPFPLRRPSGNWSKDSTLSYDVSDIESILSPEEGIIEPITWSLVNFFSRHDNQAQTQLVTFAIDSNSASLLGRVHTALTMVTGFNNEEQASWAKDALTKKIIPALTARIQGT